MQFRGSQPFRLNLHLRAKSGIRGHFGRILTAYQTPHVLPRATADDGQPTASSNITHRVPCVLKEKRKAETLGWVEYVDKVMGNGCQILYSRLGGANRHSSVYLAAVGVDHFPAETLRQRNGQRGLPNCRGTDDADEGMPGG